MLRFVRVGFRPSRLPTVRTSIRSRASSTVVASEPEPVPENLSMEDVANWVVTEFPEAAEDWRNVLAAKRDLQNLEDAQTASFSAPPPPINWGFIRKASRNPSLIDKIEKLRQEAKAKPSDDEAFSAKYSAVMAPLDEAVFKEFEQKDEATIRELEAALEVTKGELEHMERDIDENMANLYTKQIGWWAEKYPQDVINFDYEIARDNWPSGEINFVKQLSAEEEKLLDEGLDPETVLSMTRHKRQELPHH